MTADADAERTPAREGGTRASDLAALTQIAMSGRAAGETVPSGFESLDTLLGGGFRRGDLVILGGDVGSGKSALSLAIALRAATRGHEVAFLSGEMTVARVLERALALDGRVPVDHIRRGNFTETEQATVASAAVTLRERTLAIDYVRDTGVAGVSDFLAAHLGVELVVVDPLQYLALGRLPLEEEVADAARSLKELAIRRSAAVLAVSHLAQSPRSRSDRRPRLDDFGGLGAIRQHADIVLGLFREELYDAHHDVRGAAELHVLKNRNGPIGFADLYFYREWLRFEDVVEPE